jgi:CRP-like cAMP-binding protein
MNVILQRTGHPSRPTPSATNATARAPHRSGVLTALSSNAFSVLEPHLRHRDFEEGSVLWEAGDQIDRVYFPLSGMVSIVLPVKDSSGIEVATVGREGAAGIDCGLGQAQSLTQGVVQIAGTFSYMSALQFANAARQNDEIDRVAAVCCNWLLAQSQQMAACNAVHSADARFCRWLLQSGERIDSDVVPSTQEAIGRALGIRRTTVTLIAKGMQTAGIISYRRGKIVIRDRDRLRSAACDCCAALGRHNWPSERLIRKGAEPFDPPSSAGIAIGVGSID